MPNIKVEDTFDEFFGGLERDVNSLTSRQIEYGYFEEDQHPSGNPTSYIAFWNNYGTQRSDGKGWHIPPRGFLELADSFVTYDIDKYNKMVYKAIIRGGKQQINAILKHIGDQSADSIREAIDTQSFQELAPSTVVQKGSDVQLIETNTLYDQAKYKITQKSKGSN
jgi:hypothetical protein